MTPGMTAMVVAIFASVCGATVGFIGLVGDWHLAKMIGLVSIIVIAVILWLAAEAKPEALDRFFPGRTDKN